jgi:type I restriction enzyme R subunit
MSLNESIVEDAALEWFGELGYAVGHGPHLAPVEPAAEWNSFSDLVLVGRLREAIRRLNPAIPEEARATLADSATVQTKGTRNHE